jgi:glycine/D-amino acid oxidase-like deaminating enzyme
MKVVVVGCGVIGAATARALAAEGAEVVALERFELGHADPRTGPLAYTARRTPIPAMRA